MSVNKQIFKTPPDGKDITNSLVLNVTSRHAIHGSPRPPGVTSSHNTPVNNSQNASSTYTARKVFIEGEPYNRPVNNVQTSPYGGINTPESQQTYAAYKAKLRPVGIYSQYTGNLSLLCTFSGCLIVDSFIRMFVDKSSIKIGDMKCMTFNIGLVCNSAFKQILGCNKAMGGSKLRPLQVAEPARQSTCDVVTIKML